MSRTAIAVWQGSVSTTLDFAQALVLVDVVEGTVAGRRDMRIESAPPQAVARQLEEASVSAVICGAISVPLMSALRARGIRVIPFIHGRIEDVIRACLEGNLTAESFLMAGCRILQHRQACCAREKAGPRSGAAAGALPILQREVNMRIAIPMTAGRLSPHFGHCEQFALLDVDQASKKIVGKLELQSPEHQPGLLPRWLTEKGATLIIAGGIGAMRTAGRPSSPEPSQSWQA